MRECHCQLCGRLPATDPLAGQVAREGWTVLSVPADGRWPSYAFTVGLWHSFGHAEASVFGRDEEDMADWLDALGREVEAGGVLHPESGESRASAGPNRRSSVPPVGTEERRNARPLPRPVLASWHRHLFGAALAFYRGQPVPMIQLVWPDADGLLPWEPGCAADCLDCQPRLWDRFTGAPDPPGWSFPVSPDALVLTTKAIAFDGAAVKGVVHDEEGEWQFLDDPAVAMEDLTIVHLAHVVAQRPELEAIGGLPAGFEAWLDRNGRWNPEPLDDALDP